jgi:hypothetical protein
MRSRSEKLVAMGYNNMAGSDFANPNLYDASYSLECT